MNKNILLCSDDRGFMPLMVLINSILETNNDATIHIVQASISEKHKAIITDWVEKKNGKVIIYQVDNEFLEEIQRLRKLLPSSHVTAEGFFRLYAVNLLKDMDRVLYLDIDTVVDGDLTELFEMDFEGNYFCAAEDSKDKDWTALKGKLGIPYEYPYINSGVLLMNLELLRDVVDKDFVCDFLRKHHARFSFCDQDLINKAWYDKIKVISNKYNCMCREPKGMRPARYEGHSLINHYTGPVKFWNNYDKNCFFWNMDVYAKYVDKDFSEELYNKVHENIKKFMNNIYITVENKGKRITSAANWGQCLIYYFENVKAKNGSCIDYLESINAKNVAIFGTGEIGKFVYNEIQNKNPEYKVKYFIDRSEKIQKYDDVEILPAALFAEKKDEVDAIIIGEIKDSFESIGEYLELLNIDSKLISVYQLLFYVKDEH